MHQSAATTLVVCVPPAEPMGIELADQGKGSQLYLQWRLRAHALESGDK